MKRSQNETSTTWGQAMWQAQPRWLRALAIVVMFPAWLVMALLFLERRTESLSFIAALTVFSIIGGMELLFVAKAYWRHEF